MKINVFKMQILMGERGLTIKKLALRTFNAYFHYMHLFCTCQYIFT